MSAILFDFNLPALIRMSSLARIFLIRISIRPTFLRPSPGVDVLVGAAHVQRTLLALRFGLLLSGLKLALGRGIVWVKCRVMLGNLVIGPGFGCFRSMRIEGFAVGISRVGRLLVEVRHSNELAGSGDWPGQDHRGVGVTVCPHGLQAAGDEALPHTGWVDGVMIRVEMV